MCARRNLRRRLLHANLLGVFLLLSVCLGLSLFVVLGCFCECSKWQFQPPLCSAVWLAGRSVWVPTGLCGEAIARG